MIIPSIDIQGGQAVQLIGGKERAIEAGDPRPLAEQFGRVGEIAVIDLDAAMGTGNNTELIRELLAIAPCRVGGGIRDAQTAVDWLDDGAAKVILGTAATPEILKEIPRDRVIAAVDAEHDQVVVEGWRTRAGESLLDRIGRLREFVGGFLVTLVEREGRMTGLPIDRIEKIAKASGEADLTIAGGVRGPADIAAADRFGVDTQVGMALYSGAITLGDGFSAPLRSDRADGLWPTIVADERGRTLGLVYSSGESLHEAIETGRGVYYSRSRGEVWRKGQHSGNIQELLSVRADCDRDALLFTVRQHGDGFCHTGSKTCFGEYDGLDRLQETLMQRLERSPPGSYTAKLLGDRGLIASKLLEEAGELLEARTREEITHEAADLLYFLLVRALSAGVRLSDIEQELDGRARRVTRRPGNAKPRSQEKTS